MKISDIIFSQYLSERERKAATKQIAESEERGRDRVECEYRKTRLELKWLDKIRNYLNELFAELAIVGRTNLKNEQVHFFPKEEFDEVTGKGAGIVTAVYNLETDLSIYADKETVEEIAANPKLLLFLMVLHEAVHSEQYHKFFAFKEENCGKNRLTFEAHRLGYFNQNIEENDFNSHEHFRGFNEAITQRTVLKIIKKHSAELVGFFKIRDKEKLKECLEEDAAEYSDEIAVVDKIAETLARKNKETKKAVWQRFAKGSFTGRIMHLREIEKTFGAGSLRVLAAMQSGIKPPIINSKNYAKSSTKILRFFSLSDQREKDKIALEILNQRERFAYLQRKREAEKLMS
jgi:hypothetical protein